jgi:plastocyanin
MRGSSRPLRQFALALACSVFVSLVASPAVAQDEGPTVNMLALSFDPIEVHVAPGTTVTWSNTSRLAHTVTADDGSFDSAMVDPGGVFSLEFDTPGSYPYYCIPHGAPGMHGMAAVIIVDDPGS